jgi:hypothetical protein
VAVIEAGGTPAAVEARIRALLASRWPETFHEGVESNNGR